MIRFDIEQPGDIGVLTLEGSFSIQYLEELKSNLITAFHTVNRVFVNVEDVSDIDISCLELFCSAHRTSAVLQKTFAFSGSIPEPLRQVVNAGGFSGQTGCMPDVNKTCLWTERTS